MESERHSGLLYVAAWLVLIVLTGVSYGASLLQLGLWGTVVALGIATVKATVVVLVFMHLMDASASVRLVIFTVVVFIVLLAGGMYADVAFR